MSDGIHNDYDKRETLEMLRERYKNPWLVTATVEEIHAMIIKYQASPRPNLKKSLNIGTGTYWAASLPKDNVRAASLLARLITEAFTASASSLMESIIPHSGTSS